MVASKELCPLHQQLIEALDQFPASWALTPVYGDKRPYRRAWQTEIPITKDLIKRDIKNGKARGYGLRTGTVSGGIVAIDADGPAAHDKINELSGGVLLPETVAFTSNKPGRCQYLFYVPQEYWHAIATKKISTGVKGDDGKEQKLELRWDGCQSVLPPSVHPETGFYRWRKSPEEVAIAPCPMWIIEQMLNDSGAGHLPLLNNPSTTSDNTPNANWTDKDWALSYLNALSSYRADNYEDWLAVGMVLHSVDDSLLTEWDNWSRQSSKYKPGGCEKKWRSFNSVGSKKRKVSFGTLAHMAKQDGWTSPFKSSGRSYGGGIGSGNGSGDNREFDGSGDDFRPEPNHWNAPVSWNGEIGWLVPSEKPVMEINPETGKQKPKLDSSGQPITETVLDFYPKCNFDFQIEQELSSVDREDGGGIVLQVKRSIDSEQKRVIIKSVEYGSAKDFETALKKALGDGIVVNLKSDQLKSLIHVRLREYRERGGRKYRLCDRIGQQEDGTWVFENKQFTKDGQPTTQEESGWVYNPQVSPTDTFFCPKILDEDSKALRNLIEAQKKVAGSNFMRFLLCDGYVAACLNEQTIVKQEGFMPIFNPYGDPGGLKTFGTESALSLAWGTSDKLGMCSASESYLYERLSRYGSIPSLWDDPPSKRREDKERLDELIKRNYGKFARKVRGSDQHPHSSFIPTTNHATGDTLPATKSRGINLFFPVVQDANFDYQPQLEDAKAKATGAFRQIISIGYDRTLVREVRARLQKHLPTAHDRTAIHLAILAWYTQKVVDLAGFGIDVEAWVIKNLCPELNEAQTGLNSVADFVERFIAAKSTTAIGTWNCGLVTTAQEGNCLAIHMPSVWSVIERADDPPPYNRSVLERVLVEKGALKNKPAKLDRDRDSALAYQREIHKGRNEGDGWIPPSKPKPVNKKCLLIPERLWGDLGFLPDSSPDDDGSGGGEGLVTSGNLEVTSSNLDEVTTYKLDNSTVSAHCSPPGNLVTKKNIDQEKSLVELEETQQHCDNAAAEVVVKKSEPLFFEVTRLPESLNGSESLDIAEVELVTNVGYFEVTSVPKEVTSSVVAALAPIEDAAEAAEAPAVVSKLVSSVLPRKLPPVGTRIEILTGTYSGLVGIVQYLKYKKIWASPEAQPEKPELGYFADEYKILGGGTTENARASTAAEKVAPAPGAGADTLTEQQLLEFDYSSFPVNNARMVESVRGTIARIIRHRILDLDSSEAFDALRYSGEYTIEQLNWVSKNLLTPKERTTLQVIVTG